MSTITIVGSLNYDLVTYTEKVPEAGETFAAHSFETHLGGKGLNEAIAVARLLPSGSSTKVRMIGNVGSDNFGKELKEALVVAGVDVSLVSTQEGPSGVAVILVEESGENRILITPGANGKLTPTNEEFESYFSSQHDGYVILQNEFPAYTTTMQWLKKNRPGINIAYNPSPFQDIDVAIWGLVDLLILNEGEARACAKSIGMEHLPTLSQLALQLARSINQNNVNSVIITCGAHGSIYTTAKMEQPEFFPSSKVEAVVDTTGAGDTFLGGVVSQLAIGNSYKQALEFATRASAIVIQKKGAVESIPQFGQV